MNIEIEKLMLKTVSQDIEDFLNELYNAERKLYISKRTGLTVAYRGALYRKLEDEAWGEFNEKFPFKEWRVKILERNDVAENIRVLKEMKMDQIVYSINNLLKCTEIISIGLDTIIEKSGLRTMILNNVPVIVNAEELKAIDDSADIEKYYKGLMSAAVAGEKASEDATKLKKKPKAKKELFIKDVKNIKIIKKVKRK